MRKIAQIIARSRASGETDVHVRTLAEPPVLNAPSTMRTDVNRVLWSPSLPPEVKVSGHVYDVETGLVTTVVEATASPN